MRNYMSNILKYKAKEIATIKTQIENEPDSIVAKYLQNGTTPTKKSFKNALQSKKISVIAEIKRKSPSKGDLAIIPNPAELAADYMSGGASAISVLTDTHGFNGDIHEMQEIANKAKDTNVAILRKDFILDEIQIAESAAFGANAVLLIVAVLGNKTETLLTYSKTIGIDALIEVHNREELDYAVEIGAEIIGVNNRNLLTFEVDVENAVRLKSFIPDHIVSVAESGIHSLELAQQYASLGYNALLIGEALVKSTTPKLFIDSIRHIQ